MRKREGFPRDVELGKCLSAGIPHIKLTAPKEGTDLNESKCGGTLERRQSLPMKACHRAALESIPVKG